jgi:glycosyltransferase involved in cell wall biosynthesis
MHERTNIQLSRSERSSLEAVAANRNSPQKHVWRALTREAARPRHCHRPCSGTSAEDCSEGRVDEAYFQEVIAPLLDVRDIGFVDEINESAKTEFLGQAAGLLFPIDWPEPFGLVMIEAMACGTPVLAFRSGSVTEIVEDGVTGRIVSSVDEAVNLKLGYFLFKTLSRPSPSKLFAQVRFQFIFGDHFLSQFLQN